LEALRAGLLAPRVERRRPPGGARRGCLVPVRARSARTRDAHGDLEHERWRVADRSVSRECGFKLSNFPRKSAEAAAPLRARDVAPLAGVDLDPVADVHEEGDL